MKRPNQSKKETHQIGPSITVLSRKLEPFSITEFFGDDLGLADLLLLNPSGLDRLGNRSSVLIFFKVQVKDTSKVTLTLFTKCSFPDIFLPI